MYDMLNPNVNYFTITEVILSLWLFFNNIVITPIKLFHLLSCLKFCLLCKTFKVFYRYYLCHSFYKISLPFPFTYINNPIVSHDTEIVQSISITTTLSTGAPGAVCSFADSRQCSNAQL